MSCFELISEKLYGKNVWDSFPFESELVDLQGWNGEHPSLALLNKSFDFQIIIDVGVWKGQSTIMLAKNLRDNGIPGVVLAVDTFLGSPQTWDWERGDNYLYHRTPGGMPDIFSRFANNVFDQDLCSIIIPIPQTSVCAAHVLKRLDIRPTLVHVDAAHEYEEASRDMREYFSLLSPGGIMIGDDYHPNWPGVVRAANEFAAEQALPLVINSPKFILQKPLSPD